MHLSPPRSAAHWRLMRRRTAGSGKDGIKLTFRRLGASRWPEAQQIEYALRVAAIARTVLSADSRRAGTSVACRLSR
jgi:hypothetical protein